MLYTAGAKNGFKAGNHDPDRSRLFGVIFQPTVWQADVVYKKKDDDNWDVIIPTVYTGLYYKVNSPGISGATEPAWVTTPGEETEDGTTGLVWEACLYNLMPIGETIASVTVEADNDVDISGIIFTDGSVDFMIDPIIAEATARLLGTFSIAIRIVKSNLESEDCTIIFKLAER